MVDFLSFLTPVRQEVITNPLKARESLPISIKNYSDIMLDLSTGDVMNYYLLLFYKDLGKIRDEARIGISLLFFLEQLQVCVCS